MEWKEEEQDTWGELSSSVWSMVKLLLDCNELLKGTCSYSLQVDLMRTFTFRNSKQTYTGIPIIVANMDTVGTFEMAVVMAKVSLDSHFCNNWEATGWQWAAFVNF